MKRKEGRPPHQPTDDTRNVVINACVAGLIHDQIATLLGITRPTLERHYARELAAGKIENDVAVAQTLVTMAKLGNVAAAIFYAKTRMGWSEKSTLEIVSSLNDDELEQKALAIIESRKGDPS